MKAEVFISKNETIPVGVKSVKKWPTYIKKPSIIIQGSTASYRKNVFHLINLTGRVNFAEDNLFNFIIYASGSIVTFINDPLIFYRSHANALGNKPRTSRDWRAEELKSARHVDAEIEKLRFFLEFTRSHGAEAIVDVPALQENLAALQDKKAWPHMSIGARALSLLRDILRGKTSALKWKMVRLWGDFPDYWPKRSLAPYQRRYRSR